MEYFYLIKATQKSGKADAIIWRSAKSEARAQLQLDVDLEDAEIETGRGKDYQKPIRTDFPVFNDLPAEGVLDYSGANATSSPTMVAPGTEAVTRACRRSSHR